MSSRTWAHALICLGLSSATATAGPYMTHPLPSATSVGRIQPPLLVEPTAPETDLLSGLPVLPRPEGMGLEIPLGTQLAQAVPTTSARTKVQPTGSDPSADGTDARIPEPASLVLLVTGIVGLTARREIRRRRLRDAEAA